MFDYRLEYILNFDIYQGRSPNSSTKYEDEYGKAATPLMNMLDDLPQDKNNSHILFILTIYSRDLISWLIYMNVVTEELVQSEIISFLKVVHLAKVVCLRFDERIRVLL